MYYGTMVYCRNVKRAGERNPNMIDVNEINIDAIRSTITFLSENEEYGDDWSEEIATLEKVMDFCLEHGHRDE